MEPRLPIPRKELREAAQPDLGSLCHKGHLQEAVASAENMYLQGHIVSKDSFYALLRCCKKAVDVESGRKVLCLMVRCRLEASAFLGYHVVCLFSSCGSFPEAHKAFVMIAKPNVYTFHSIILACIRSGDRPRALELYSKMQAAGIVPDAFVFSSILSCCCCCYLDMGMIVHDHIVRCGAYTDLTVANALIDMYSKCRCLNEANKVFDRMPMRDIVSWSSLICGYAKHECGSSAMSMYEKMEGEGICPNTITFLSILKACAHTNEHEKGKLIHEQIVKVGNDADVRVSSALVHMYAKCGSLEEAWEVFVKSSDQDVVSWGTMISALSQNCDNLMALELFEQLVIKEIEPDVTCFSSALKSCGRLRALTQGRLIHMEIFNKKLEGAVVIGGALVDMYVNCRSLNDAEKVFKGHPERDVVLYGTMISGFTEYGHGICALQLYTEMQHQNVNPNKFIYSCVLKACGSITAQKEGELVYDNIIRSGVESELIVGSAVVDMYAKCSRLLEARKVFENLLEQDSVSWGAMIVGHAQCGRGHIAFEYFEKMHREGVDPDTHAFSGMLKACGSVADMHAGWCLHGGVIEMGCESDEVIANGLVDMYVKCGNLDEAMQLFERMPRRNIEAWGAIISGYICHGHGSFALHLLSLMQQENVEADDLLFVLFLRACGSIGALSKGKLIHFLIVQSGLIMDATVGNSLLEFYCKCGKLDDAQDIFDRLQTPDVLSWGALVMGYSLHDDWVKALHLFECMREDGIEPCRSTLLSLLKACGSVGAIWQGMSIHGQILKRGLESDILLSNTILDTYAKCGSLEESWQVFDKLPEKDLVAWGALVAGYAQHGKFEAVEECLQLLQVQGMKPNDVIFTSLLVACSHTGLHGKGCAYFNSMAETYDILPSVEQYSCMIDLFGSLGYLYEAKAILHTMGVTPDFVLWTSLLNSSGRHGASGLGQFCFDELIKSMAFLDTDGYVLETEMESML